MYVLSVVKNNCILKLGADYLLRVCHLLTSIINNPVKHNACELLEDIRNLIEGFPYILKLRIKPHICSSKILPSLFYFSTLIL